MALRAGELVDDNPALMMWRMGSVENPLGRFATHTVAPSGKSRQVSRKFSVIKRVASPVSLHSS